LYQASRRLPCRRRLSERQSEIHGGDGKRPVSLALQTVLSVSDKKYILARSGKPAGPYSLEELKSLSPRPNDFVKMEGEDDYYEIHENRELSQMLSLPYQGTRPQYFATLDNRLLAWGIDMFLSFALYSIVVLLPVLAFTEPDSR